MNKKLFLPGLACALALFLCSCSASGSIGPSTTGAQECIPAQETVCRTDYAAFAAENTSAIFPSLGYDMAEMAGNGHYDAADGGAVRDTVQSAAETLSPA